MTRSSSLPRRLVVLLGSMAIIAACSGATPSASVAPSSEASGSVAPSASQSRLRRRLHIRPTRRPRVVSIRTRASFKKITCGRSVDRRVPALQSGRRIPRKGGVRDLRYPGLGVSRGPCGRQVVPGLSPMAPGRTSSAQWDTGNRLVFDAFDGYWGEAAKAPNVELRWSDEHGPTLVELQSGAVDGIDNPGREEHRGHQGRLDREVQRPRPA